MRVEIWHNPDCGNSRGALALIRASGIEPTIVDYLRDPPAIDRLRLAIADAGLSVRAAIRAKEAEYAVELADKFLKDGKTGVDEKISMDCVLIDAKNAANLETFALKS